MAENKELTDEEIGLIACFCWSRSKELLNKEKHDMLNDEEFAKLEDLYFEESKKRQKLQELQEKRSKLQASLNKLENAKDNPYEAICDMKLSCYISYSDCEGHSEIDRDYIGVEVNYDQFVSVIKDELEKINKEIEAIKATYMSK